MLLTAHQKEAIELFARHHLEPGLAQGLSSCDFLTQSQLESVSADLAAYGAMLLAPYYIASLEARLKDVE